jgi:hypothetical protein
LLLPGKSPVVTSCAIAGRSGDRPENQSYWKANYEIANGGAALPAAAITSSEDFVFAGVVQTGSPAKFGSVSGRHSWLFDPVLNQTQRVYAVGLASNSQC